MLKSAGWLEARGWRLKRGLIPQGFTIIETAISTLLFVLLMIGLLTLLLSGQTSYLSADASVQVQQEARRAFESMVRELREAGPPGVLSVIGPSGSQQLNFQIARAYNAATCPGAICWGSDQADGEWVHYALVSNPTLSEGNDLQLVRCVSESGTRDQAVAGAADCPGGYRVLANNVQSADFSQSADTVTLTLRFRYQNARLPGGSQGTQPLSAQIRLRNP